MSYRFGISSFTIVPSKLVALILTTLLWSQSARIEISLYKQSRDWYLLNSVALPSLTFRIFTATCCLVLRSTASLTLRRKRNVWTSNIIRRLDEWMTNLTNWRNGRSKMSGPSNLHISDHSLRIYQNKCKIARGWIVLKIITCTLHRHDWLKYVIRLMSRLNFIRDKQGQCRSRMKFIVQWIDEIPLLTLRSDHNQWSW